METAGDRSPLASFGTIGAEGVFVREIEESLLTGRIDVAVHSFKDLPSRAPAHLVVAAVPPRRDAADILVLRRAAFRPGESEFPVRREATLGTASARRTAWVHELRPDLVVTHVRGNVPTRIGRIGDRLDGVVLAAAGVERLRESPLPEARDPIPEDRGAHRLSPDRFIPAPRSGRPRGAVPSRRPPDSGGGRRSRSRAEPRTGRGGALPAGARGRGLRDGLRRLVQGRFARRVGDGRSARAWWPGLPGADEGEERRSGRRSGVERIRTTVGSLRGRSVLVTRARGDCAAWAARLQSAGARPVTLPCIECHPITEPSVRRRLTQTLPETD